MSAVSRRSGAVAVLAALWIGWSAIAVGAAPNRGVVVSGDAVAASSRSALVIGNARYQRSPLVNTTNDARGVAEALRKLGFAVTLLEDATLEQMGEGIRHFGDSLSAGSVGVFFFAGHGVQVGGHNYLVPTGVDIQREEEVRFKAIDAEEILGAMEAAHNRLNVVILDACRNNPFATRGRSLSTPGFASMEAPVGSIIAFSTQPGAQASDGSGTHGLYTQYLLKYLTEPGLKVEDIFKRVRLGVRTESAGRQIPWESTSLEGDFYFAAGTDAAPAGNATPKPVLDEAAAREHALWDAVKDSRDPRAFALYLERYPSGRFAPLARSAAAAAAPAVAGGRTFSFAREDERLAAEYAAHRDPWAKARAAACPAGRQHASVRYSLAGGNSDATTLAELELTRRLRAAGWEVDHDRGTFDLAGSVVTQLSQNRRIDLQEIAVSTSLSLTDSNGAVVATGLSRVESFAGGDGSSLAPDLIRESAGEASAQLYADFCQRP